MAVAALDRGIFIRKGECKAVRNLDGTIGRPRGANDRVGLGEGEGEWEGEGEGDEAFPLSSEDGDSSTLVTSSADFV
jgi:hypothetical protein